MNYFDEDTELSKAAMPLQDAMYKYIFKGMIDKIERFKKGEERHILDVNFHIDIILKLKNGISLLGQEKALRKKHSGHNALTIEFWQDRFEKIEGEFFNLGAQFYSHGYLNGNAPDEISCFEKFYIIKVFDYLESLRRVPLEELEKRTKPTGRSRASFYYINYDHIPKEFIYYQMEDGKELIKKQYFDFNINPNPIQRKLFKES